MALSKSDHDLLIQVVTQNSTLCKKFDKHTEKITDTHKEIFKKVDQKVDGRTFRWITGIIIGVILIVASLAGTNALNIVSNTAKIVHIEGNK